MDAEILRRSQILEDLGDDEARLVGAIAQPASLRVGDYLFLLGDAANRIHVVLRGAMELCLPLSFAGTIRDVGIESMGPGKALGWSALVKPYRYTLSARAQSACELASFARQDLLRLFEQNAKIGYSFMKRVSELIGARFLVVEALWARELQRAVREAPPMPRS